MLIFSHFVFFLFIAVFLVALYASLQIYDKLKAEIDSIISREDALIEQVGGEPVNFHRFVVLLMVSFAQRQRLDVGCIKFIYNYVKQAVPKEMQEACILEISRVTTVEEGEYLYSIVDLNDTLRKDQLIFDEKCMKKLSVEDVVVSQYTDEEDFADFVQSSLNNFSETGRKYFAYLVCRVVCAASQNNPDFSKMNELFTGYFSLGDADVEELLTCCRENRLPLWYGKHIQEANKYYPAYDKFVDILRAEYPTMPPYDWKKELVKHANQRSVALYAVLTIFNIFGVIVFRGSSLLLIAAVPLLIFTPSIVISYIFHSWLYPEVLILEDNKFKWKPTSLHRFFIFYTFGLYFCMVFSYVLGLF